jgi:hypothetical protein
MTGEQLIENCTETVHVCCARKLGILTSRLFWRHVARRTQYLQRARDGAFRLNQSRQPEISQMRFALPIQQNVTRFYVSVQDSLFMREMHRTRDFHEQLRRVSDRHWRAFNNFIKLAAFDELHAEVA